MRGTMAGGVLGLVLCGSVLVTVGLTQILQEKDLYVVVGSTDTIVPHAEGTVTTQTELRVGITAATSPDAAMHRLTAQWQQQFPPAQGYTNHRIVAVHKVPVALLMEVLATKHPPRPPRPLQPYL